MNAITNFIETCVAEAEQHGDKVFVLVNEDIIRDTIKHMFPANVVENIVVESLAKVKEKILVGKVSTVLFNGRITYSQTGNQFLMEREKAIKLLENTPEAFEFVEALHVASRQAAVEYSA